MYIAARHFAAFPLALSLLGCVTAQDTYETRMRASDARMAASVQDFSDKLKAQGEAQIADYDRRLQTWKPLLREYSLCNKKASAIVAAQSGDPISLAVAARNLCRGDEQNLRKAIYAAYTDNPSFGMEAMESVRKSMLENNTGEIAAHRATRNTTPAPNQPAEPAPKGRSI